MKTILLILFCTVCISSSLKANEIPEYLGEPLDLAKFPVAKLYKGDDFKLVAEDLNVKGIFREVSSEQNVWRIQLPFIVADKYLSRQDIWFQLRSNVVATTVSINGQLLLKNGAVGQSADEEAAGRSLVRSQITNETLKKGVNVIQLEFSNYRHLKGAIFRDVSIGPLEEFQHQSRLMSTAPLVLSGIFLFSVIANLGFYFAMGRQIVFLTQTLLFSLCFLLMLSEVLYWNGLSATVSLMDKSTFTSLLEYAIYISLLLTLNVHFKMSKKWLFKWFLAFIFLVVIAELVGLHSALVLSTLLLAFCLFVTMRKEEGSILMLAFSVFFVAVVYIDQSDILDSESWVLSNFIITSFVFKIDNLAMAIFSILMMVISSRRILRNTIALNKTKMQLEQLEFQFVQKHIQPHFLMNTLMSLQQLIKTDQKLAGEMVEALSEEFYLMTNMLKRPEVKIDQEIRMCYSYLKIMSLQQKANFELKVKNISGDELIPPAVFQTIIENGLTHGFKSAESAKFVIIKEESMSTRRYIISNNGSRSSSVSHSTGTGLDYVRSRLEYWWPNSSEVTSNKTKYGWETVIKLEL
ncbi:histidine kinase [Pleionea sp. CnH1-48]|uniref:histidine kinase n=1 Tax=Pleionea sp. CnH1-48 TaxID=2954494 RepID=UPI0020969021|nr:histidine kinase [Pleionea sp. CnH1-48]MCO7225570.1 histidine kinase [Pleionea sp. CnH1-48]